MAMRFLGLLALTAAIGLAQHVNPVNTGAGMPVPPNAYGYGNILFPGGTAQSHPARLSSTVSGGPINTVPQYNPPPNYGGRGRGYPGGYGRNRTTVVPYAVPVYIGGDAGYGPGYGAGYGYGPDQPSNVTVVMPQQQQVPSVIINQGYTPETANPVLRDYSQSNLPEARSGLRIYDAPVTQGAEPQKQRAAAMPVSEEKPTIYLIALKNSTVYSAIGYWTENGTLHYVTPQGSVNRVTLDQVDRETTLQLNRERKLDFDLKAQ